MRETQSNTNTFAEAQVTPQVTQQTLSRTLLLFVFLYVCELAHFPYVSLSGEEMLHQSRFRSSNTKHSIIRYLLFLLLHKAPSNNVPSKTTSTYDSPKVHTHTHTHLPRLDHLSSFFYFPIMFLSCTPNTAGLNLVPTCGNAHFDYSSDVS